MNKGPRFSRGSILLLSLWATATLAVMSIAQATRLSLELKWADRLEQKSQAWYLAWAGVEVAAQRLALDPEPQWDASGEAWAQWPVDPIPFGSGDFKVLVSDEQSRIPLNGASPEILGRLPGFTQRAVDELLARRSQGKLIAHLGELVTIDGFNSKEISALEPLVTMQVTGSVNFNTASVEVLQLLGFSSTFAQRVAAYRKETPFKGAAEIIQNLKDAEIIVGENSAEENSLKELHDFLQVKSSFFRVEVEGRTGRHGIRKKVTAILAKGTPGGFPMVRGWYETR